MLSNKWDFRGQAFLDKFNAQQEALRVKPDYSKMTPQEIGRHEAMLEKLAKGEDLDGDGMNDNMERISDGVGSIFAVAGGVYPNRDGDHDNIVVLVGTDKGKVEVVHVKKKTRQQVMEGHFKRLTGLSHHPSSSRLFATVGYINVQSHI